MFAVKRLHQESDNSGLPTFYGHHWGVIGVLTGLVKKIFCIPLCADLHEGLDATQTWQNNLPPLIERCPKVGVNSLMTGMAANLVP